jgi:CO/xanthine dehydrogenase Mo-binding subunit
VRGQTCNQQGNRQRLTSCFLREALDKGAALFKWEERKQRSGQRRGSKIIGVGVGTGNYNGGSIGFDGLLTIRPDGKVYIQMGAGNLGTLSVHDSARIVPEVLGVPWEQCEVIWGSTAKHVPWTTIQGGSMTIHAQTRANHAAAMDLKRKLQEIAANDLGGRPESYEVGNGRVFRKGGGGGLTFAQAAKRAIALGGKYDGHQLPEDINDFTKTSATALAGLGLMGVAKDNYGRNGQTQSFVASFAEVEVDVETGTYRILDYLAVGDVGIVVHPHGLEGQLHGGAVQAFGQVMGNKWVYDLQYGMPLGKHFYHTKPPTMLDVPLEMQWDTVNLPDPETPVGAKGVGEVAECAAAAALRCALAAAVGDDYLRRTPITLDMILSSLEAGRRVDAGLVTHV